MSGLREPQVENAVKFLTNPKVTNAPLSQKLAFLQNKGLTEKEVAESLRRANAASAAGGADEDDWGASAAGAAAGGAAAGNSSEGGTAGMGGDNGGGMSGSGTGAGNMPQLGAAPVQYMQVPSLAARSPFEEAWERMKE